MPELFAWLFEDAAALVLVGLALSLLMLKWLLDAVRGVVIALHETRHLRGR